LATSQRPHPPPVPPRPSRQVVAEALKRSPRPPCPTRQAPPPPNTKPWRSDQQQQQVGPTGGRTIIYESIKECVKDIKDENVSNDRKQQDRKQARNAIERNAEDSCLENEGKIVSHDHRETSDRLHPTGNVPVNIVRKRNSLTEDQRPQRRLEIRRNSRGKDLASLANHRGRCKDSSVKDQENNIATEKDETTAKLPVAVRTVNVFLEDEECRASSASPDSTGGRVALSHAEKCNGSPGRETNGPTSICRSSLSEQQQRETNEKSGTEAASSIEKSSVANVDRAATTVLVVDEAERKIAPGDREDGNDSDNNIHRQDWLEAGIHYSSTQITLHGDDGDSDAVDGDRLNGYDHHEEERITDLDYIR